MKRKAFILTLPITNNFGCALQAYALGCVLKQKGYKPIILNKMWNDGNFIKQILAKTIGFCPLFLRILNKQKYFLINFLRKNYDLSPPIFGLMDFLKIKMTNNDLVVFGSDQIWNPEISPGLNYFFGNFIKQTKIKRIAYAASFGSQRPRFTVQEKKEIKTLLKKFDVVSVRENEAISICQKNFCVRPKIALDPTLLCEPDRYEGIIKNKQQTNSILKILLQRECDVGSLTNSLFTDLRSAGNSKKITIESMFPANHAPFAVESFLEKIYRCKYVLTDSYHGMLFSIIFKKSFLVIPSKRLGGCSSRITTVLSMLKINDRFVKINGKLPKQVFISEKKWKYIEKKLKTERNKCLKLFDL